MKQFFWLLLFTSQLVFSQKLTKADKKIFSNIKKHIGFLADDKLEGRRTGSNGEKLASEYISRQFLKAGIAAKGDNDAYTQVFEVNDGRSVNPATQLIINDHSYIADEEYFTLSFCPNATVEATGAVSSSENKGVWFFDLKDLLQENKDNPHFDLIDAIKTKVTADSKKGAAALLIYNSGAIADELKFDGKSKSGLSEIPVLYITKTAREKYLNDNTSALHVKMNTDITLKKRSGHNVVGYINNNAPTTIVLGAHYDHLGYGEDHNSLYAGTTPQIHNGADDNASGTAALIELSKLLKKSDYTNNNYVFVSFSGEELGLYGSKYFVEHPSFDLSTANCMINLDMVGRLNDSTRGLSIGGYGTSPTWGELLQPKDDYFTIKFDSSGSGPSDHTSFYRKDIPVLFFFTGLHMDYHKPSDDADKINYAGELQVIRYIYKTIGQLNDKGKISFTKTKEAVTSSKSSFKVTMGIMPDYTFSGTGVRADGISDGKPAQKAGLKAGDIVLQIGDYKCDEIQAYMQALSKFKKGDATKVKVLRGTTEMLFDIVF